MRLQHGDDDANLRQVMDMINWSILIIFCLLRGTIT